MSDPLHSMVVGKELAALLNRHNIDGACETPDFILSALVMGVLRAYRIANQDRETWFGRTKEAIAQDEKGEPK